jgi:hypothetical protein
MAIVQKLHLAVMSLHNDVALVARFGDQSSYLHG